MLPPYFRFISIMPLLNGKIKHNVSSKSKKQTEGNNPLGHFLIPIMHFQLNGLLIVPEDSFLETFQLMFSEVLS